MPRTVIVPENSPILRHYSTTVLNRYSTGSSLVVTDSPNSETGEPNEIPIFSGLRLATVSHSNVDTAQNRFRSSRTFASVGGRLSDESISSIAAYVEFIGPPDMTWLDNLRNLGINILTYHPENSYLCYGPITAFHLAQTDIKTSEGIPAIQRIIELTSDLKVKATNLSEDRADIVIVVICTPDERVHILQELEAVPDVELLGGAGNDILDASRLRIRARVRGDGQTNLLKLPRVLSVEPYHAPTAEDEVAGLILAGQYTTTHRPSGSYLQWLQDHGINGSGVTIGIVDGGVDVSHPAFSGRVRDLAEGQKDWHATMVAGHAAGNYLNEKDEKGFIYGLGTAPAAEILSQDKMLASTNLCRQTATEAGPGGGIQNNSWGKETHDPMDYGSDEALYDALVRNSDPHGTKPLPLTICFSSGNSGARGLTRPKAAKNVIVTGNSESFRPDIGRDGSDNIQEVYSGAHGSSYGNCGDGRIRPHIVAPGEWTASANYDCHPGEDEFISPLLTWGGGSSGASPKTAGACALLTHWWQRNNNEKIPSPAMLRALIVNGAEPIITGGDTPNNRQGWGRLNIENIIDSSLARVLVDQTIFLSQPGETREWCVRAVNPTRPVKITLAWTDPPGAIGSGGTPSVSPVVNKFALRAKIGTQVFRGSHDRFRKGISASDDAIAMESNPPSLLEGVDNLQNIFLSPDAVSGPIRVSVTALNVTTNCLTGRFESPQQDFALVITNGQLDTSESSSNISLLIDHNSRGVNQPTTPDNYWADVPGNSDKDFVGISPAPTTSSTDSSGGTSTTSLSTNSTNGQQPSVVDMHDDNAWWENDNPGTMRNEAERLSSTSLALHNPQIAPAISAAVNLLKAIGHQIDTIHVGEWSQLEQPNNVVSSLSEGITKLNAIRERTATILERATRPVCAALVMGIGTRVTIADILSLRALGAAGRLFLVSYDPGILAFLAQRIGKHDGIRYRLTKEPDEFPDLILDTLAEAGGLQPIVIPAPETTKTSEAMSQTYRFTVVPDDKEILLQLRFPVEGNPPEVRLMRAGAPVVSWSPSKLNVVAGSSIAVSVKDNLLQFRDSEPQQYVGTWAVEVSGDPNNTTSSLKVWALGGPRIFVNEDTITPGQELQRGNEPRLVKIAGEAQVSLLQAIVPPPRVSGPPQTSAPEAPRDVVLQVRRSRLDNQGDQLAEDSRRPMPVAILSHIVQVPPPSTVGSVVDLPISVLGVDSSGNHFARGVRTNIIRLLPLSLWQAEEGPATPRMSYVSGRIAEATFQNGIVTALRIMEDSHSRMVSIASPFLGKALAAFDYALQGQLYTFGIQGHELRTVLRTLEDGRNRLITDDHGIEKPVNEFIRPRPEAEDTDYPDATRFIPAASFGLGGDGRRITRIVIHITDGGSQIEGPISWFQNPSSKVSAHYIVGQNGEVVQMVRDRNIAWHASNANHDSIGIEHCARASKARGPHDPGLMPTTIQYEASGALVRWLCEQYGIPIDRDHILGHSEADTLTTHSGCPNSVWNWEYYMALLTSGTSLPPPGDEAFKQTHKSPRSVRGTYV